MPEESPAEERDGLDGSSFAACDEASGGSSTRPPQETETTKDDTVDASRSCRLRFLMDMRAATLVPMMRTIASQHIRSGARVKVCRSTQNGIGTEVCFLWRTAGKVCRAVYDSAEDGCNTTDHAQRSFTQRSGRGDSARHRTSPRKTSFPDARMVGGIMLTPRGSVLQKRLWYTVEHDAQAWTRHGRRQAGAVLACFVDTTGFPVGTKLRVIESDRLAKPLEFQDHGDGHVSIVPRTEDGTIDDAALREWAATRSAQKPHDLTQKVLDAVVEVLEKKEQ